MHRLFQKIHAWFRKRSKSSVLTIILSITLLFGWLDYITGFEATFSFFYLIPIAIATWYVGTKSGYFITFLSMTIWVVSNFAAGEKYSTELIRYWNTSIRTVVFIFIVRLLEEFKHALHHERLLAQTDHLTGIPNRREFYFQAEAELRRAGRFKRPITIAYIDVDTFKQINDQFGQSEGDHTLQIVAQSIQSSIRQTDTVARLGGDEFTVLLPDTDQNGAASVINKVQAALADEMEKTRPDATLSIGVVTFENLPASVDELLHRADEIMYEVKATGKNGVKFIQI